jgi:hypothetical protein
MLIEGLLKYDLQELATKFFQAWFLGDGLPLNIETDQSQHIKSTSSLETESLDNLIPLKTMLELAGINKLTPSEIIIGNFNPHFAPITVQYQQTIIMLSHNSRSIEHKNGEKIDLTKEGVYSILPS